MGTEPRNNYKLAWNALSETERQAILHVIGDVEECNLRATAEQTRGFLEQTVEIRRDDIVLEIGCGIGRVGQVVAPLCKQWIGCDVSHNMLMHSQRRLADFSNVSLVEVSGFDLHPIADASVDLVYCTVVFMHLDEWDRYNYIREAHRVLRPEGRIFVDNYNLCSDEGWQIFEQHWRIPPDQRPSHISKSSTPQELKVFLHRAGFRNVKIRENGAWVHAYGVRLDNGDVWSEEIEELQRLHAAVAQKDVHINQLEQLLARIEQGRLLRLLNWVRRYVP